MMRHWHLELADGRVARLTFDQQGSPVNSLGVETLEELDEALARCERQPPKGLLIRSGKPSGFIAGADVRQLAAISDPGEARALIRRAHRILQRLEDLPCPTVAAVHGFCLGGGLELALACTACVVSDDPATRLGFPEIRLGIFPGFGGTARAPARVGHLAAMRLMLGGRTLSGSSARRIGLADECVPLRQLETAALARLEPTLHKSRLAWWQAAPAWPGLRPLVASRMRRLAATHANPAHYPAPEALIRHWQRHAGDPVAVLQGEAETVPDLLTGAVARNLLRAFLLREHLRRRDTADAWRPRHLHVVGAGVMGGDIAAWAVLQGLRVSLQDQGATPIAKALARARAQFERKLRDRRRVRDAMDRLIPDPAGDGVPHADVVLEAIVERASAKCSLFQAVLPRMRPDALLATNTSSIPLEVLGADLEQAERLVGLHFFNPVAKMPLVEIVYGPATSDITLRRAAMLARMLDKTPVTVRSHPGFLVNRILMPYLLEAAALFEEGVPVETIDRAATDFGMPMGPLELADTAGLDICLSVVESLSALRMTVPRSLRKRVDSGQLGRKTGRGYYRWPRPRRLRGPAAPNREQQDRLMLRLVNESVACLREGIVGSADELDAGMLFGTGFAPFRGGPLRHIEETGAATLHARLLELERRFGERFRPDPGWQAFLRGDPP
ncbi:3-hydroxyacyl-CoA dehydrogenase NAD-binding domain-containing protein [Thioalkalivibrio paradoxus]|uniref:enoyl-CoA hydratase n=1 Tax=Thioalkalivibrio paradoxus ARh 1 TaxID=713585 RepID=W0DI07_9GAMM|nr:3-hydroxyacyl-CoA dehydrogenase NAD-binding domain-containing protein [Thioalkalivibrio paradoxus]AHE98046.1 crotonase [Thioalkalivibrio paradoxus ARh 1]